MATIKAAHINVELNIWKTRTTDLMEMSRNLMKICKEFKEENKKLKETIEIFKKFEILDEELKEMKELMKNPSQDD